MNKQDLSKITVKGYTTSYAMIDFGDGKRCAWCKRLMSEFKDENEHIILEDALAKIEKGYDGSEELLYKDFIKIKKALLNE